MKTQTENKNQKAKGKPELPVSLGRNGYIKTSGLVIELVHEGREVLIAPLTSRKSEARCYVSIPAYAIETLMRSLSKIRDEQYSTIDFAHFLNGSMTQTAEIGGAQ